MEELINRCPCRYCEHDENCTRNCKPYGKQQKYLGCEDFAEWFIEVWCRLKEVYWK